MCPVMMIIPASHRSLQADVPIPVVLTAYKDKSFEWEMKTPPASYFIKKAAGLSKGGERPGHGDKGYISLKHVYEIAKVKSVDRGGPGLEALCSTIISSARAAGVKVVRSPPAQESNT